MNSGQSVRGKMLNPVVYTCINSVPIAIILKVCTSQLREY